MDFQGRRTLSGKVSIVAIAGLVGIAVIIGILVSGGESPETAAARFMGALAEGDAEVLAETSFVPDVSDEELLAKWKQTVEAGKYYKFLWDLKGNVQDAPDQVKVGMDVWRNFGPNSYEERFTLVVKKQDGEWKVLANAISREMYPFLPRF